MDTTRQDAYLLTPGPLTTSLQTKQAMLRDWGSWDADFNEMTARVGERLVAMIGGQGEFVCVPLQGSGTFVVEAALGSLVPPHGKVLVLSNGAYGKRMVAILGYARRAMVVLDKGDQAAPLPDEVEAILRNDESITHVAVVHCETSSGILNPIKEIGAVAREYGKRLVVDAMSSFGALPLDCAQYAYDAVISSANKCLEGVPGFGFALVRREWLEASQGQCHAYSLDLYDQWQGFLQGGKWRFTPPTHVVAAFAEALRQHEQEGGVRGRLERYTANRDTLVAGMRKLGFTTLLTDPWLSPIIVTFVSPAHPNFEFARFYAEMRQRGFLIYPGKLTAVESFRVGCIGHLDSKVMQAVVAAVAESMQAMQVTL